MFTDDQTGGTAPPCHHQVWLLYKGLPTTVGTVLFFVWMAVHSSQHYKLYFSDRGQAVAPWLRHLATNRKVAGSILDVVIGTF
jgi:hypothetical protein